MKRLLGIILCITIMVSVICVTAVAKSETEDIFAPCIGDLYYEIKRGITKTSEDDEILIVGTVYGRYGEIRFDASSFESVEYGGAVLSMNVRSAFDDAELYFYGSDNGKTDGAYLLTLFKLTKSKRLVEVAVTDYVKKCLDRGDSEIVFFIRSNVPSVNVFSSEVSDKSQRPALRITEEEPYIPGQMGFTYPVVTAEDFRADLEKSIKKGHPYMIATNEDFEKVREYAFGKSAYLTDMYSKVKESANKYVDKEPSSTAQVTTGTYNSRASECLDVISSCAFVYKIEGDEKYATRAWREAEAFINLPHWGTSQYIDNNFPVFALSLLYDWMYDWLDQAKKDAITTALTEKHFNTMYDMLCVPGARSKYTASFYAFYWATNNHALLDNTATFCAAMAIADVYPEMAYGVMQATFENLKGVVEKWYPDGVWYEGLGYWQYTGVFMARWLRSMQTALGTTYGIGDIECVKTIAHSMIYGSSAKYEFVVNDNPYESARSMAYTYMLALFSGDNSLKKYALENGGANDPFSCLAFDVETDYSKVEYSVFEKDKYFRNVDQVTFRDTWDGTQPTFGGMHVQDASVSHGVMNSGSLAFEALGHLWVTNPGRDDYELPGYWENEDESGRRWTYYFSRAEANSCLVINPGADGGQRISPGDAINEYRSNNGGAFAVSNLTNTYAETAESYKRGVRFDDDRTRFTCQDEVRLYKDREVYAFYNVNKCDAVVSDDGKTVTLSNGNRKVNVSIVCDTPYELSIMSANPLPTSPQPEGNRMIRDIKRIAVHFPAVKQFNLKVVFTPYIAEEEIGSVDETIVPMDEWTLPEDKLEVLRADSAMLDGKTFDEFVGANRFYTVETLPETLQLNADPSKYEISYRDTSDGRGKIALLKSKETGRYFSYLFELPEIIKESEFIDTANYKKIDIIGAVASTHDGNVPENTLDGDMSTRWSAAGRQSITFQLKDKIAADYIGIAFYNGSKRKTYFDIEISADRKKWETVSSSESSGKTDSMEFFSLQGKEVRYIRLSCYGNSANQWNSLSEVEVYKAK